MKFSESELFCLAVLFYLWWTTFLDDLVLLLAEQVFLNHTAANGVVEFLVFLKGCKGNWAVNLLEVAVPGNFG